ncbi:hypothetical protein [Sagittula sp. MA-2]|uniref:hypothetical protein n=1 Tax=Sagittula sp. MA-2 TaxID=3048007 RepID=UPI0024C30783|nr:hypothetical protein [Sagittula sp. MA-2]WHZ36514.1 hypothetical protein QNI11_05750 [Sagittula sp. MA-2]
MILETAKQHFDEDYARAMAMRDHADGLPHGVLRDDLLRSAWMVGVGAGDAFFCDAYADLVSRTLRAKERQTNGVIPDRLNNLRVPVIAVISAASSWRWRMAARELIEKESVLSLKQIKDLLNVFCRKDHRLLSQQTIEGWVLHGDAQQRHFSVSRANFLATAGAARNTARKSALEALDRRMQTIFQRRHDCIHNCDRPKYAIQPISSDATRKAIEDVGFLVARCTDHMRGEYTEYLRACGFTGATRNGVGA